MSGEAGGTAEAALVIFSGGQDSTTCLAQAVRERGAARVRCITFQYGQRHAAEVEAAREIAAGFGVAEHRFVQVAEYGQLTTNALLDATEPIRAEGPGGCPNTVVDGRNLLFLLLAAVHAKRVGIRDLVTGVCEADGSGYPDCRAVFIRSCNATLNLAMDYEFRILTPLIGLTKEQIWALADELGCLELVASRTLTCYNGVRGGGCGACPSCVLRRRGYEAFLRRKGGVC